MTEHEHSHRIDDAAPCPICSDVLAKLLGERFSGPVPPRAYDLLTPKDRAELARRLTFLAELPLEEDEPA